MIVKCSVLEEITADEDSTPIKTYGLQFYDSGNHILSIKTVKSIFFKKENAGIAAKLINENNLCDVHISAIIDDLIS